MKKSLMKAYLNLHHFFKHTFFLQKSYRFKHKAMKKTFLPLLHFALLLAIFLFAPTFSKAQSLESDDSLAKIEAFTKLLDSLDQVDKSIPYKQGKVSVNEFLTLNVPSGYKFVPETFAKMIVSDLWKNPKDESILGMVVPNDFSLANINSWAFIVSYEESGYVKDEDAEDIDYDQMMKDIQSTEIETNNERTKQGYDAIHILGWAAKPYYDKNRKILHWAKKIQFGNEALADEELTLNYEVRMLGRKGVLSMNAVGTMYQLDSINKHIPDVLNIATFNDGYAYKDFNPSVDKVAAYTIGGLIAGKLIAKTGLLILLLKNIKLILLAFFGFFGAFRKKIFAFFNRKKSKNYEPDTIPAYTNTVNIAESETTTEDTSSSAPDSGGIDLTKYDRKDDENNDADKA